MSIYLSFWFLYYSEILLNGKKVRGFCSYKNIRDFTYSPHTQDEYVKSLVLYKLYMQKPLISKYVDKDAIYNKIMVSNEIFIAIFVEKNDNYRKIHKLSDKTIQFIWDEMRKIWNNFTDLIIRYV